LAVLRWAENPRDQMAAYRVVQLLPGAGPATAQGAWEHLAAAGFQFSALDRFQPPPGARRDWPGLMSLMCSLGPGEENWYTQLSQVRVWYQPHLQRIFDDWQVREGDVDALEQIASRYRSRERFLSELTLDPTQATGDLAGAPMMDEDFLILSTVHSAKGQEWDSVYVLNVADGNFPSEFATGKPALIEEERRLLYVAMTRARLELHLLAPLKYYVPQQRRHGDRHVYGARSRFINDALMERFQRVFHGMPADQAGSATSRPDTVIDVASRTRQMW